MKNIIKIKVQSAIKKITSPIKTFYKKYELKIATYLPFILILMLYTLFLSIGDEESYYTNLTALLFITLLSLINYLVIVKVYSVVIKGITSLQNGQQILSKNQKATHDLLVRFNEAMQTVSQHNATEKIIFENKLFEELTDIRLKSNLTDSRTIIILEKVEEIDGRRN